VREFTVNVYRSNFCFDDDARDRGGTKARGVRTDEEGRETEVTHGGKADRKARCNYCWELDKWKMHSIIVPSFSEKADCLPELCVFASFVSSIAGVLSVESKFAR